MKRKRYQPPQIDLLECLVEQGFSYSGGFLEGFSYGNSYSNGSFVRNDSGRAEGFTKGNSYNGAMFS